MEVGGSLGFNARYTGSGSFAFEFDTITGDIVDTSYTFNGLGKEVKFLSITKRSYFERSQSQFYMGLMKNYDGVDFLWGDLNGYFYARCIKKED